MKTNTQLTIWVSCGLGFIALSLGTFLFFSASREISKENATVSIPTQITVPPPPNAVEVLSSPSKTFYFTRLPDVDYPLGSIGDVCGVNEFPPRVEYTSLWLSLEPQMRRQLEIESPLNKKDCSAALEGHIYSMNPYLWAAQDEKHVANRAFSFIVIDNPLTFERIFNDPVGDFARVQEALMRPECQLSQNTESNWNLNETCHADAILNYALLTRFCYDEYRSKNQSTKVSTKNHDGVSNRSRQIYRKEDNPTPAQDRSMWIQDWEDEWMRKKCKNLDPNLDLQMPAHYELRKQIQALQVNNHHNDTKHSLNTTLIELAARLGDEAAGLTQPFRPMPMLHKYYEEGYKYGPFVNWFTNKFDRDELFVKHPPSIDRLRQAMSLFAENLVGKKGRKLVIDHEALVQHLCTPPYYSYNNPYIRLSTKSPKSKRPPSCRTVVNELRQEFHNNDHMLESLATFEDVAMRLDVYE